MNRTELLERVLGGRFVLVGEFRGGRADVRGYVDRKSGLASSQVIITYVVESALAGAFSVIKVFRKAPAGVSAPEQVTMALEKGRRYAFEIESLNKERGLVSAWLATEPELID